MSLNESLMTESLFKSPRLRDSILEGKKAKKTGKFNTKWYATKAYQAGNRLVWKVGGSNRKEQIKEYLKNISYLEKFKKYKIW